MPSIDMLFRFIKLKCWQCFDAIKCVDSPSIIYRYINCEKRSWISYLKTRNKTCSWQYLELTLTFLSTFFTFFLSLNEKATAIINLLEKPSFDSLNMQQNFFFLFCQPSLAWHIGKITTHLPTLSGPLKNYQLFAGSFVFK